MAFAGARRSKSRPFAQRENPAPRILCFRRLLADDELPDFSGRKEMKSTKFSKNISKLLILTQTRNTLTKFVFLHDYGHLIKQPAGRVWIMSLRIGQTAGPIERIRNRL